MFLLTQPKKTKSLQIQTAPNYVCQLDSMGEHFHLGSKFGTWQFYKNATELNIVLFHMKYGRKLTYGEWPKSALRLRIKKSFSNPLEDNCSENSSNSTKTTEDVTFEI